MPLCPRCLLVGFNKVRAITLQSLIGPRYQAYTEYNYDQLYICGTVRLGCPTSRVLDPNKATIYQPARRNYNISMGLSHGKAWNDARRLGQSITGGGNLNNNFN